MGMEQRGIRADLRKDNLDNLTEGGFGEDQSKCREQREEPDASRGARPVP